MCPTRYRTRHFFNNSDTNEDIATKFEQEYFHCVRNEKECVCSVPNCCDTEQRSASQPGLVASGTHCIYICMHASHFEFSIQCTYLNASGWSVRPIHVARVDGTDKSCCGCRQLDCQCNIIYRKRMNSSQIA